MKKTDPLASLNPLTRSLIEGMLPVTKAESKPSKNRLTLNLGDPINTPLEDIEKAEKPNLTKSILNLLNGGPNHTIERLAFEEDPRANNTYASVFKQKHKLIPDVVLKRIAIQDSLVASIVNTRSNQVASFGRPQPDHYSTGYKIEPDEGQLENMTEEAKAEVKKRIQKAERVFATCGSTQNLRHDDHMTFSQYLAMSTRNAVVNGRIATEMICALDAASGEMVFHSFRPIDAGTIFKAAPYKDAAEAVRKEAIHLLNQVKNKDLEPERFKAEEYAWVQVVDGQPLQAFTPKECVVHNFYPVTDVELDGYPVTPMDTAISDIMTHINITTHNKMYFQTGRATRGMLVIKSDDVNEDTVTRIKQQFQASINSVSNAWRMPVFGVGAEDEITWQSIDSGSRDMEFQYLSDSNARVILSAFQMAPEELPGWAHLSRGTNSQALSEGNNEWKLEAARDVGIRPLMSQWEDFINTQIFPLIDPVLAKFCRFKLVGLDAETEEKENVGLQQAMPIHMTMDEVLAKVEKKPLGLQYGGEFPLNPQYQAVLDKYMTVGQILERFFGVEGASQKPELSYMRDPFWFQMQTMIQQQQQMQMQQQAAQQQQAQGGQPQPGQPGQDGGGQDPNAQPQPDQGQDLSRSLDQVIGMLSKSEAQLPAKSRRLLHQQRKTVDKFMEHWADDLKDFKATVMDIAEDLAPKKE